METQGQGIKRKQRDNNSNLPA